MRNAVIATVMKKEFRRFDDIAVYRFSIHLSRINVRPSPGCAAGTWGILT
jgi:hypothetical protein